jgi:hypothetical protein
LCSPLASAMAASAAATCTRPMQVTSASTGGQQMPFAQRQYYLVLISLTAYTKAGCTRCTSSTQIHIVACSFSHDCQWHPKLL